MPIINITNLSFSLKCGFIQIKRLFINLEEEEKKRSPNI